MEPKVDVKTILIGILILLVGVVAAYFAFISDKSNSLQKNESVAEFVPTPTSEIKPSQPIASDSGQLDSNDNDTNEVKLLIESESTIPGVWRSELQKKIIDPLLDYYEEASENKLVSLTIRINQQANKNFYPYLAEAVFKNESKLSFVIEKNNNSFNWWRPECLDKCAFTKEFSQKYPEIVKP